MLNEVKGPPNATDRVWEPKHLAHEWEAILVTHGMLPFGAQILRYAQDYKWGHPSIINHQ